MPGRPSRVRVTGTRGSAETLRKLIAVTGTRSGIHYFTCPVRSTDSVRHAAGLSVARLSWHEATEVHVQKVSLEEVQLFHTERPR